MGAIRFGLRRAATVEETDNAVERLGGFSSDKGRAATKRH
ncbi:hypothetical protein MAXJ12_18323 [Mesorhizobium alhagi CCNWXJ12-2]|uniref:Uncharacterized protein n=1 Tax=Mesorhizobium alhagi CCNWXJ12-2 TaxID=1107882 RepID=H0HU23_9HYPH|nr:hypothetical protein MAXJ12_18323 [Mesorhizobium alhagi CCNWXJ12-2]